MTTVKNIHRTSRFLSTSRSFHTYQNDVHFRPCKNYVK